MLPDAIVGLTELACFTIIDGAVKRQTYDI
jgi:hypothetical protein